MPHLKCRNPHKGRKRALLTGTEQSVYDFLDRISLDVSRIHLCDLYYCEKYEGLGQDYKDELKGLDMMVVFMALNLEEESRALSLDLKYAIENNIPILPLAMENPSAKKFKSYFGDNILAYIASELLMAKHYLEKGEFKLSRNALWRVIKECKTNGGYGKFIDNNRIVPYVDTYITLGDAFVMHDDLKQGEECYTKAIETLNFYEKEIENPCKEEALRVADCWLRLTKVFYSDNFHIFYKALSCLKHSMAYVNRAKEFGDDDDTALCGAKFELMRSKILSTNSADPKQMSIFKNNLIAIEELVNKSSSEELFLQLCYEYADAGIALLGRSAFDGAELLLQKALVLVDSCPFYINEDRLERLRAEINTKLGVLSSLKGNEKLSEVYCLEAIDALTDLAENLKIPKYASLLAEAYLACSDINKYYGMRAVTCYKSLYRLRPNTYRNKVKEARRILFRRDLFGFFDYFWIKLHYIEKDDNGYMIFENKKNNCRHRLRIIIDGESPADEIETINIDECILDEVDGKKNECPPALRLKPKLPSKEKTPPDELIHIVFKSASSGMYLRIYG